MTEYLLLIVTAIFVNNILLGQFLGNCPFLGTSQKMSTATGMAMAVIFVLTFAGAITYAVQWYLLVPYEIEYLQTIAFILVIAALVQLVEIVLQKTAPALYKALGIFLPLITTNCAVLGAIREIFGTGKLTVFSQADLGVQLIPLGEGQEFLFKFMVEPPGAFVCLGGMLMLMNILSERSAKAA